LGLAREWGVVARFGGCGRGGYAFIGVVDSGCGGWVWGFGWSWKFNTATVGMSVVVGVGVGVIGSV